MTPQCTVSLGGLSVQWTENAISEIRYSESHLYTPIEWPSCHSTPPLCCSLLLIATYNIGKESIFVEVVRRCGFPIYISEKKFKLMRLLDWTGIDADLETLFTLDPTATPVHAIPWNLIGETWPYFRPNFTAMEEYADKCVPVTCLKRPALSRCTLLVNCTRVFGCWSTHTCLWLQHERLRRPLHEAEQWSAGGNCNRSDASLSTTARIPSCATHCRLVT